MDYKEITPLAERNKIKRPTVSTQIYVTLSKSLLKSQLLFHHCLTIWLQIWYHSFFGVNPVEFGKLIFFPLSSNDRDSFRDQPTRLCSQGERNESETDPRDHTEKTTDQCTTNMLEVALKVIEQNTHTITILNVNDKTDSLKTENYYL